VARHVFGEAQAAAAAPVQSVNTQTGAVVLGAADVGADVAGAAAAAQAAAAADATTKDNALQPQRGNVLYVDGANGSDVTPGPAGYATIGGAMAVPPAAGDMVWVAPGVYPEDVVGVDGVTLWGPGATVQAVTATALTPGDRSHVRLKRIDNAGVSGIHNTVAGLTAYIHVDEIIASGSQAFSNRQADAPIFLRCDRIILSGAAVAVGGLIWGDGRYDIDIGVIESMSDAPSGLITTTGGTITGRVGRFLETGGTMTAIRNNAGTIDVVTGPIDCPAGTGVLLTATGTARVIAPQMNCTTAYNVANGSTLDLICSAISGTETIAAGGIVVQRAPRPTNTLYVDSVNGDDARPSTAGHKTIQSAVDAADVGDGIEIAPGTYTEDVTITTADLTLWGPGAHLVSATAWAIKPGDGSSIMLGSITASTGDLGVYNIVAAQVMTVVCDELIAAGAGSIGAINSQSDTILNLRVGTVSVAAGAVGVGDVATGTGHVDVQILNVYATGNGATGFTTAAGGLIVGTVGHFLDQGFTTFTAVNGLAGTIELAVAEIDGAVGITVSTGVARVACAAIECTTGLVTTGAGVLDVSAAFVNCTTAYNISGTGALYLTCTRLVGTETVAAGGVVETSTPSRMRFPQSVQFPNAPADTNNRRFMFPADNTRVWAIYISPIGGVATAGTIGITKGIVGGGADLIVGGGSPLNLFGGGFPNQTMTAVGLNATLANLQGNLGDAIEVEVINSDASLEVFVVFGPNGAE